MKTSKKMVELSVNIDYRLAERVLVEHYSTLESELPSRSRIIRVLALANAIAAPKAKHKGGKTKDGLPDGIKYFSKIKLKEIMKETDELLALIEDGPVVQMIQDHDGHEARLFQVAPEYMKETKVELDEYEFKFFNIAKTKQLKLGSKYYTNNTLFIDIPYDVFVEEVSEHLRIKTPTISDEEVARTLKYQWSVIQTVNRTGMALPRKSDNRRCSSLLTELSKPVDPYLMFNGQRTISIDQHATYFTILPRLLIQSQPNASTEYVEEVEKLKSFIKNTTSIYKSISADTGVSDKEIKIGMNSYLCDPNSNRAMTTHDAVDGWFKSNFPLLHIKMNLMRNNGGMSYSLMNIESEIFGVSRKLKELGIECITKFDEIRFLSKDKETVKKLLEESFIQNGVEYKGKISQEKMVCERIENGPNIEATPETREESRPRPEGAGPAIRSKNETSRIPNEFSHTKTKKTLDRPTFLRLDSRGRWVCTVKRRPFAQTKAETLEQFQDRVVNETGTRPIKKEEP